MIQLLVIDGKLYTPLSAIVDPMLRQYFDNDSIGGGDPILLVRYPEGDCDTIRWPLRTGWEPKLASALYDAREQGAIPMDDEVLLPNGETFNIDRELK